MIEMRRRWEKLSESQITVSGSVSVGVHPMSPPAKAPEKEQEKSQEKVQEKAKELRLVELDRNIELKLSELAKLDKQKAEKNTAVREMEQTLTNRQNSLQNFEKQKKSLELEAENLQKQVSQLEGSRKEAELNAKEAALWEKEQSPQIKPQISFFSVVVFAAGVCVGALATFYYTKLQ
jgi:DNA repair exonuclease SbcCD ATPase subunit